MNPSWFLTPPGLIKAKGYRVTVEGNVKITHMYVREKCFFLKVAVLAEAFCAVQEAVEHFINTARMRNLIPMSNLISLKV